MMKLYDYFRSSAAYRVRIALNLKDILYEQVGINLLAKEQRTEEYLAVNPQGLVPALELDDGQVLTQSTAIMEWLEEEYPQPALYPAEPIFRAKVRALASCIACDTHPLNNLRVLKYIKHKLGVTDEQKTTWYQHWIALAFESLEGQLAAAPYAMGDQVSMVDVYLVPQVYNALRIEQDMTPYPKISQIYAACNELPAFQSAAPEAQPDTN